MRAPGLEPRHPWDLAQRKEASPESLASLGLLGAGESAIIAGPHER